MASKCVVRKNSYHDSVTLMIITKEVEALDIVENAVVVMGTDQNKELLRNIGLLNDEIGAASPNDLVMVFSLAPDAGCDIDALESMIVSRVDELLSKRKSEDSGDYCPPTLDSAVKQFSESNLVLISLPGQYAAAEAKSALLHGKHVMLFSDNVTIEQEKELKELAVENGLLMMGPDCGTAMINSVPLAFANVVKKGNIGIVGASGTGTQEIMVQIDRFGGGISQVIGTGGRDLKAEIGGLMMIQGITALGDDAATDVIVLVSKPPAPEVAEKVLKALKQTGKKAVIDFIGGDESMIKSYGLIPAETLEDAAFKAVELGKGKSVTDSAPEFTEGADRIEKLAREEASRITAEQKYLRGLFSGGTLCDEALKLFSKEYDEVYSNIPLKPEFKLPDSRRGCKHSVVDLGDDEFTVGRPHPMIDSYTRQQMMASAAEDKEMAILLLDMVLGYGSNEDPAGSLAEHINAAKMKFRDRGQYLCVIASICGTASDPQDYSEQERKLADAGVVVLPSNAQAVRFAMKVLGYRREV